MKVVAVFVVACIAVALAYPYDDRVMKIQRGNNRVVYNEELDQWEEDKTPVHVQEECNKGKVHVAGGLHLGYLSREEGSGGSGGWGMGDGGRGQISCQKLYS